MNKELKIYSWQRISFLFSCFVILFFGREAYASQIYFENSRGEVHEGDIFDIEVLLNSHDISVNAYAATIQYPSDLLEIRSVDSSGSIIYPWIDLPTDGASGISFAGITPGGVVGERGQLFSITFEAIAPGMATLSTIDDQVLRHDGRGTATIITRAPLTLDITPPSFLDAITSPIETIIDDVFGFVKGEVEDAVDVAIGLLQENITIPPAVKDVASKPAEYIAVAGRYTTELASSVGGAVSKIFGTVRKSIDDPRVEAIAKTYVAPGAIGVSFVAVTPSLFNVLVPLMRYLFLQPLLVLGRRKRREWGEVYNSLAKLPVDLAIVRLIDSVTGRVVQTRVTDQYGRYVFIAPPGSYRIEVDKNGFSFPSVGPRHIQTDGRSGDLYHGGSITVTEENTTVAVNIPLDPVGIERPVSRIVIDKFIQFLQRAVSVFGIVATLLAFIISPTWYIAVFLMFHLIIYFLFLRYVRGRRPRNWGVVSDASTHLPVDKAVVRLFAKEYDKFIDTQITGNKGRYAFLVGQGTYYLTVDRNGYERQVTAPIDMKGDEGGFLIRDLVLEKKS